MFHVQRMNSLGTHAADGAVLYALLCLVHAGDSGTALLPVSCVLEECAAAAVAGSNFCQRTAQLQRQGRQGSP